MDWITTTLFGLIVIAGLWTASPRPKPGSSRWKLLLRWLLFGLLPGIGRLLISFTVVRSYSRANDSGVPPAALKPFW